jgi:hypothetical protein
VADFDKEEKAKCDNYVLSTVSKEFSVEKIKSLRERNSVKRINHRMSQSDHFINNVTSRVTLDDLYSIIGVCNHNSNARWCPVLLEVGEKMTKDDGYLL